ncbi:hypothetical protein JK359_33205 [Streptomyces actinomycinicus]|uniref:Uncharacterized protein n=1 Tax=Streptomyces actinomycinicus TaxID=1695166 RepID=A0A937EPM2_9ACTN|nr:hypothetical protein [Streptomyces actinomycinicus]MBL1086766.1 hypothetical protein [Streptomyces actinomycinicus]
MTTCPTHQHAAPPRPQTPFRRDQQPGACKNCMNQLGTDGDRRAHYCPCCGERLTTGCLGTRREPARCLHCGRIDAGTLRFLPEEDLIADLLAGNLEPSAEFTANQLARAAFGDQVAFHIGWSWQDRDTHHGQLTVRGREIQMRLRRADQVFEAATPCTADKCRGRRWTPVATTADLLALHTHGPSRVTLPCDRCGPNAPARRTY